MTALKRSGGGKRRSSIFEGSSCDDEQSLVNSAENCFSFILNSSEKLQTKESENIKKFLFKYVSLSKTFVLESNESFSKDSIFSLILTLKLQEFGEIIYFCLQNL